MFTISRKARRQSVRWLIASVALVFANPSARPEQLTEPGLARSEYECVIEPRQVVKVATPSVGVIARLDVDRGDVVYKGQILGTLATGVETATLALAQARATNEYPVKSAEARLKFLQLKLARITALEQKSISTLADLQEAEAEVDVAEQQLKEAKLAKEIARLEVQRDEEIVKQRTLRSEVNGVVVERLLNPGEYRDEHSPILTLAEIDKLRVEVFLPIASYGEIQVGGSAEVRPEPPIGGTYAATVTVVDRVLDAASGTFGVRLALPNPKLLLPAGIRCKILFNNEIAGAAASALGDSRSQ
jgi:RND family efflux transporter MFP subunit